MNSKEDLMPKHIKVIYREMLFESGRLVIIDNKMSIHKRIDDVIHGNRMILLQLQPEIILYDRFYCKYGIFKHRPNTLQNSWFPK